MKLSNRVNSLTQSSTIAVSSRAKELKNAGQDVIALGFGEPRFNTPQHILMLPKSNG